MESGYSERRSFSRHPLWRSHPLRPFRLDLELTERCNNACQHCCINLPENDLAAQSRELATEEWQGILQQAADLGVLIVRFTGGEPLLRPDFVELYLFARRLGLQVQLYTNARLINREIARLLQHIPPLQKIEISVYGMRPAAYDAAACAPGAYTQFQRGIDLLLEHEIPFLVKAALISPGSDEMESFEAWAAALPGMEGPPGYVGILDLRSRRDHPAKNRQIERLRLPPAVVADLLYRRSHNGQAELVQFCTQYIGPPSDRLFNCGAGNGLSVDAYGVCQPCLLLRDPCWGYDLKNGTLQDAMENYYPRLQSVQAQNPVYLERCARCFLYGLCEQCPAKSWSEHGTWDTPVEYLCQIAHVLARRLGLLNEGEVGWEVDDWGWRVEKWAGRQMAVSGGEQRGR